jgi:RNA polymerase sigma-B factor
MTGPRGDTGVHDRTADGTERGEDLLSLRRRTAELFAALPDRDTHARDELVRLHLPLVEHCARRFRHRGESYEDLVQVGTIGLLKAIDRFDARRDVEFSSYATPTIVGEIKRHFRDKGWAIRVPRRLQELRLQIALATEELTHELGRSPTALELAGRLDCSVDDVVEGLESNGAYTTLSLDAAGDASDGGPATGVGMLESLCLEDDPLDRVEVRESIKPVLAELGVREKRILVLRFFHHHTQAQIAEEIGVSQMHVSRLLNRTLQRLRLALEPS